MQRIVILCLLSFLLLQPSFAQYSSLKCSGDLPTDFYEFSTDKYQNEIAAMDKDVRGRDKRNQKDFFLESSFLIDDLLQSGYILFNDPASNYLQDVAKVILQDDEELFSELQFYAVRSSAVNAFAINQGIVFVNIGLLSQLETEAQLAFILAHEIAHCIKKHGLEFYLEKKEIEASNNRELLERTNYDDKILATNKFSQRQEIEADSLGLQLFLKTDYDVNAVQEVFDVLQFAHLPFDEIAFDKSFFEDEYLVFPVRFHQENVVAINLEAGSDDINSTHPSIPKRRELTKNAYPNRQKETRKFALESSRFSNIKERAQKELLDYNLRDNNYYRAIYNAYLLLQKTPDDVYAQKVVGKALYGISALHNAKKWEKMQSDETEIEGEISRLYHFINELEREELAVLAFRYNFLMSQKFPDDQELKNILLSAAEDLHHHHSAIIAKMQHGKPPLFDVKEEEATQEKDDEKVATKIEKIKAQREEQTNFLTYAFGDFIETAAYQNLMVTALNAQIGKEEKKEVKEDFWDRNFASRRKSSKNNNALGLKRVLVLSPYYKKYNYDFKKEKYIKSEKAQRYFNEIIQKNAKIAGLDVEILDANNLGKKDVEKFNDIRHLNEWIGEEFAYDQTVNRIAFNQSNIDVIAEKYDLDALLLTGIVNGKVAKGSELWAMLLYSPPTFLYSLFTPKGETAVFSIVLDLKTGNLLMDTFDIVGDMDNKDVINQRVYEVLWQISRHPKK